jgi:surfactin synthase thioesterase subunit
MSSHSSNPWLVHLKNAPDERVRLVCIHHAGAAASFFRPWSVAAPPGVSLSAVQLPGREERRSEPFETSMSAVVARMREAIGDVASRPYVLFGHSLGGSLAWELALSIEGAGLPAPEALGISATRAPGSPMGAPTYDLPDEAFLARIQGFGGTPNQIVNDRELLMWALPRLRKDTELHERTPLTTDRSLSAPLAYFYGTEDAVCDAAESEKWRAYTTGRFEVRSFPGSHFYLREHFRVVMDALVRLAAG